jgi:tetratricopeptide (TPR) repeat protein
VILIHGLFDDPFHGNDGALISLLFIPLGVLMRTFFKEPWRTQAAIRFALSAVAFAAVFVCVIAFVPKANAAWQANLGALRQTQIELSRYQIDTYQTWGMQDKLRKTLNLRDATTLYEAALKADASNAVAHRRLGQIALTMGEYDLAREHLEASFSTDPNHRATRQLLGEIYALSGDLAQASQIWQSLRAEQGQLESRFNWHEFFIEDHASAARVRAAIDLTQSQSKK